MERLARLSPAAWGGIIVGVAVLLSVGGFVVPWHISHIDTGCILGGHQVPSGRCDAVFSPWVYEFAPQQQLGDFGHDSVFDNLLGASYLCVGLLAVLAVLAWSRPRWRIADIATILAVIGMLATYLVFVLYGWFLYDEFIPVATASHQEHDGWGAALLLVSFVLFRVGIGALGWDKKRSAPAPLPLYKLTRAGGNRRPKG